MVNSTLMTIYILIKKFISFYFLVPMVERGERKLHENKEESESGQLIPIPAMKKIDLPTKRFHLMREVPF